MRLTEEQFKHMSLRQIAQFYGMKELDFISEVYPASTIIDEETGMYAVYTNWHTKTQNKLAKALK